MIEKKIHYIWLGKSQKSSLMLDCIQSWHQIMPDWQILQWDESNFDIESVPLIKHLYDKKQFAYAADMIRAHVLYKYGGIYLDTDVQVLRPLDDFLQYDFFVGYEAKNWCCNAVIGSCAKHPILEMYIKLFNYCIPSKDFQLFAVHSYSAIIFFIYGILPDGKTSILNDEIALFSSEYFYPMHYITKRLRITQNTHAIHRYASSWYGTWRKIGFKTIQFVHFFLPLKLFLKLEKRVAEKTRKKILCILKEIRL
ncbi:MAG: hypothetical protein LBU60_02190 [Clostridiales bacterium]|jgi:hypothetical protein|nr:hypothetical protein [Clostridiales bacterium]